MVGQKVIDIINTLMKLEYWDENWHLLRYKNAQKPRPNVLNLCGKGLVFLLCSSQRAGCSDRDLLSNVRGHRDAGGHNTGDVTENPAAARGRADAARIRAQEVLQMI